MEFLTENDILFNLQFWFRKHHSTSLALMILYGGDYVFGVFLDFSKVFDTVNHEILLRKLYSYGIRVIAHEWLKSYLDCRSQYVVFNKAESNPMNITCGVPQGSILGLLLFLLYINVMPIVSYILFPIPYADDTNVFMSETNVDDLISSVNKELVNVTEWLDANVSKIHHIIFRSQWMRNPVITRPVIIKDETIKRDNKTKFLGVILDEKLTWSDYILYIKGKIDKWLGIICKARKLLNAQTLRTLHYCYVYLYMNYCIDVGGDTCKSYLEPLAKMQKTVLRIISYSGFISNVDNVFKKLEIMQI